MQSIAALPDGRFAVCLTGGRDIYILSENAGPPVPPGPTGPPPGPTGAPGPADPADPAAPAPGGVHVKLVTNA